MKHVKHILELNRKPNDRDSESGPHFNNYYQKIDFDSKSNEIKTVNQWNIQYDDSLYIEFKENCHCNCYDVKINGDKHRLK